MRLKSFQASSMSDGLRQVKSELGEDAIIISTRQSPGGLIHITAAVEKMPVESTPTKQERKLQETAFSEDAILEALSENLFKHRVPTPVSDKILGAAAAHLLDTPQKTLSLALKKIFQFDPAPIFPSKKPLALLGPPGAGKTLTAAKIATRCVLEGTKPMVISTDTARAGGIVQLKVLLDILNVELMAVEDVKTFKSMINKAQKKNQILIDTGGLNPFDPIEMKELAKLLKSDDIDTALVLPAGLDAEESAELAMAFSILGVKRIIPTRLDFARRFGGILQAADKAGLTFSMGGFSAHIADGLVHLTPDSFVQMLMPTTPVSTKKSKGTP